MPANVTKCPAIARAQPTHDTALYEAWNDRPKFCWDDGASHLAWGLKHVMTGTGKCCPTDGTGPAGPESATKGTGALQHNEHTNPQGSCCDCVADLGCTHGAFHPLNGGRDHHEYNFKGEECTRRGLDIDPDTGNCTVFTGVPRILVVLSDGKSNPHFEPYEWAPYVRAHVDRVFAVGTGKSLGAGDYDNYHRELDAIASEPLDAHRFDVQNEVQLRALLTHLNHEFCALPEGLPEFGTIGVERSVRSFDVNAAQTWSARSS